MSAKCMTISGYAIIFYKGGQVTKPIIVVKIPGCKLLVKGFSCPYLISKILVIYNYSSCTFLQPDCFITFNGLSTIFKASTHVFTHFCHMAEACQRGFEGFARTPFQTRKCLNITSYRVRVFIFPPQ